MNKKGTKKTVQLFALTSFLNDFGSDMIYPIWPLFLTSVLGANMAVLGFIDGVGDAIVSISQAISGYVSDKTKKRKLFIWIGYLFGSFSRVGYAVSSVWQQVVPFRVLDRFGKIRSAPRDAIIADISTKENRGKHFGLLRAMDHFGAVCGIIVSIIIFGFVGYRTVFLLAAIPSLVGVLLILLLIKEKKPRISEVYEKISLKHIDRNFAMFIVLSAFFSLGAFSYSFLLIFAQDYGFQTAVVPVLYLIFTMIAAVSSLPFGRLSDKLGRKKVLLISYILWGVLCLNFIVFHTYESIILSFILYGFHIGSLHPVQRTFVSELAPIEYRASTLGGFQMIIGLCAFPASVIAGILWETIDVSAPFYFSLLLTLVSLIILLFVHEKK